MRQITDQDLIDIRANFPIQYCLPAPDLHVSPQAREEFNALFDSLRREAPGQEIDYRLAYPKYLFLEHIARLHGLMLHGSQLRDLETLMPVRNSRDSREFGDQAAIYATQDPLWALFFAVLDREALHGPINNGAIQLQNGDGATLRRYYFCLDAPSLRTRPWKAGAVYIMPGEGFEPDPGMVGVRFGSYRLVCTHWLCRDTVQPLAWLTVEPQDFPFLHDVWGYDPQVYEQRFSAASLAGWPFLNDVELYPIRPGRFGTVEIPNFP
jgi:hypothetical protein